MASSAQTVIPWFTVALKNVADLSHLSDNWDGYGSPAPQLIALDKARQLLTALQAEELPAPLIGPVSGGGLQMEWHVGDRELELEVRPDGTVEFLAAEGDETEEGPLPAKPPDKLRELVGWLTKPQ